MDIWKKNLAVCWLCGIVMAAGTSQIAPILPLYVEQLGVHGVKEVAQWSGIAFGANFLSLAFFSPIWGGAADKYGCKPMIIRASLWLALIMFAMSYVQNVYQLIGLRILQGAMSGFFMAMIPFVAKQTPKDKVGWALGMLATGQFAGLLFGPLFGGALADFVGFRSVFLSISVLALLASAGAFLFIHETFTPITNKPVALRNVWRLAPDPRLLRSLFVTTFVLQTSTMSMQPIISVYVSTLISDDGPTALVSGAIFASMGLSNILAAPFLGRLSDRVGAHRVALYSLLFTGTFFIPQAFVTTPLQLGVLLFIVGIGLGGLMPSINTLVKKNVPDEITGRAFGFNQMAQHLGSCTGAVLGGQIAMYFGVKTVFLFTGCCLLCNAGWLYKNICLRKEADLQKNMKQTPKL